MERGSLEDRTIGGSKRHQLCRITQQLDSQNYTEKVDSTDCADWYWLMIIDGEYLFYIYFLYFHPPKYKYFPSLGNIK